MTVQEFIQKYNGKKIDWDGYYGGQCVDLFRQFVHEVLQLRQPKSVRGAADFWDNYDSDPILKDNFTKISNTADFKPIEGDVMVWNKNAGGGFGHIAVVSDNNATLNQFNSFDQNWRALNVSEITNHSYKNVLGVLRPKKLKGENMVEVESAKFEELVKKATEYDKFVEAGYNNVNGINDVVSGLEDEVGRLEVDKKYLQEQVRTAEFEKNKLAEQLEECQNKPIVENPDIEWGKETGSKKYLFDKNGKKIGEKTYEPTK